MTEANELLPAWRFSFDSQVSQVSHPRAFLFAYLAFLL